MGLKNRFELGEIDPWNWGQYDGQEYQFGVAWLENFQILPQGGLNRRRGYKRLCALPSADAVRLVHVIANDTHYVLALRAGGYGIYDCANGQYSARSYTVDHPTKKETLNRMRYCTRKNVVVFVTSECRPFYIKVLERGATEHGLVDIKYDVKVVETKPEDFKPVNRKILLDEAIRSLAEQTLGKEPVEKNFVNDASEEKETPGTSVVINNPQVIAYIGNRVWLANTQNEPNKVWVSRRLEDGDITKLNFSTYNIYATVYEEYLAFSDRNELNNSNIDKLDGNAHRLREYSGKRIRDESPDGYRVDYGVDPTQLNRTSYWKDGGILKNEGNRDLKIYDKNAPANQEAASEPVEDEYTEESIAWTEAEYTRKMNMFASKKFYYVPPCGLICANCYGAEGFVVSLNPKISAEGEVKLGSSNGTGAGASFGYDTSVITLFPFTEWGEDWNCDSMEASVAIGAATKSFAVAGGAIVTAVTAGGLNPVVFGLGALFTALLAEPALIATYAAMAIQIPIVRDDMKRRCENNLNLNIVLSKEGWKTVYLWDIRLNPMHNIHPDYLTHILQWIKTSYSLYSKIQPFVGIYHKVKTEKVSTADCGFTFEIAGGTGEFIHDIEENQSILILTARSERIADYTINGEMQFVQKISGEGCEFVKSTLTGAGLYMMRAGNRSLQKLEWQPAMNAPSMTQTNQRNSDILDGFETQFLYASETYPKKIRLVSKDGSVIGVQLLMGTEAFYRETTHGKILDMQSFKIEQDEHVYAARLDKAGRVWLDVLVDTIGRGIPDEHIFLDSWTLNGSKANYTSDAVLYDFKNDTVYLYEDTVPAGTQYHIGYPYMSKLRTLPTIGFGDMSPARLPRVKIRLLDSCMPFINGYPEGDELNPNIITDQQNRRSGIFDAPVPGTNHRDAAYEIYTNYPDSLSILAICEEGV